MSLADRRRGTSASRGYGHRWRVARLEHLSGEPLCRHCSQEGIAEPATIVDHIIPHNGDDVLFWDRGNWQSLCKPHHDAKTATEDGGFGRAVNWHPTFLRPAAVSLTIVCGAPLSGKTTWVDQVRSVGDVVIDLDVIGSELCGTGLYDWPLDRLNDVGRERNRRLLALAAEAPGSAWFIVGEASPTWRAWWSQTLRPDRIVVMETQRHDCMRRVAHVDRGGRDVASAIDKWWSEYRRRDGDWIMRPGDAEPWLFTRLPPGGGQIAGA